MPLVAVALGLAASVAWGSSDFLAGVKSRGLPVLNVLIVSQVAGLVAVLAALAVSGAGAPDGEAALLAVLAGAAELVGFAALYRGLATGCMCVVAPASATAAVIPVLVGMAGGETLSTPQLVAIPLVLVGVGLAACEGRPQSRARVQLETGVGLGLLAALGFGTFFAGMGAAASAGALVAVALNRLSAITLVLVAMAARPPRTRLARGDLAPSRSSEPSTHWPTYFSRWP